MDELDLKATINRVVLFCFFFSKKIYFNGSGCVESATNWVALWGFFLVTLLLTSAPILASCVFINVVCDVELRLTILLLQHLLVSWLSLVNGSPC